METSTLATNCFNFSGSVRHAFCCPYDMLGFLTFDRGSVISYEAISTVLVFLEEKNIIFHNITTIYMSKVHFYRNLHVNRVHEGKTVYF